MRPPRPRPAGSSWSGARLLGWGLVALFAGLILVVPALRSAPSYEEPAIGSGYASIVNALIAQGLLQGGPEERENAARVSWSDARLTALFAAAGSPGDRFGQCRGKPRLGGLLPSHAAEPADCRFELRRFANASFLRDDMRFVDRAVWVRDENGLQALAGSAHPPPAQAQGGGAWLGSVRFPVPYQPLYLIDPRRRQALVQLASDAPGPLALPVAASDLTMDQLLIARQVRLGVISGSCPGNAQIGQFGDMALLTLLPVNSDAHCPTIRLDGRVVQDDSLMQGGRRYQLVQPGQTVSVDGGATLELVRGIGAVTAMDGNERRYDASLAMIGAAIANARPLDRDVTTSIDPRLHFAAQRQLEKLALPALSDKVGSYRAAAMLVDALTGEVVAAPTFPANRAQLAPRDRNNPLRTDWLSSNMNLVPLAVGSMAKVPVATAIVQSVPELLTLEVPGRAPKFGSVLGIPLSASGKSTMQDTIPSGQYLDFRHFIAQSSNSYALTLMALAAAADPLRANGQPVGADTYRIQGQLRSRAPLMPKDGAVYADRWAAALWQVDCIVPFPQDDTRLWGWIRIAPEAGCPSHYLGATRVALPGMLQPIWHNSPSLRLHSIGPAGFYEDYLMSMVGQGRSRWTTAALVQAYARIVTNREVSLRFDKRGSGLSEEAAGFGKLGLRADVWSAVTDGMHLTTTIGTAKPKLGGGLPAMFEGTKLFAKTGTSTFGSVVAEGRPSDKGHGIVLAVVRFYPGKVQDWRAICSARMVVVNFEYRDGSPAADHTPGVTFARNLMDQPQIAAWLAAPCVRSPKAGERR